MKEPKIKYLSEKEKEKVKQEVFQEKCVQEFKKEIKKYLERKQLQKEIDNIKTLEEYIQFYLKKNKHNNKHFTIETTLNIIKLLNGSKEDFVVFNNAGGCLFDLYTIPEVNVKDFVKNKKLSHYVYVYRINGKDKIIQHLPLF